MNIIWEDKEKNIDKAEKAIATASENNVDILFMPEMSFTGFSMNIAKTAESKANTNHIYV